ncbi:MAG: cytochrome c3 family protein [Bryobacteraceae bacterium]|nr:cytochrome c3 family protein [Bryobacteraceae bacterium]
MRSAIFFLTGVAMMLLGGWVGLPKVLYKQQAQPLDFSHKAHVVKAEMDCTGCHDFREDGSFAGVPKLDNCAGCHAEPVGTTANEKKLVEAHVTPEKEIGWLVYSKQPINTRFSHAIHVKKAELKCERCHGEHGKTETLRPYEYNVVSGYSRDIWGRSVSRLRRASHEGMKMDDCMDCHKEKGAVAGCLGCHR